jgi:hypothetical protein
LKWGNHLILDLNQRLGASLGGDKLDLKAILFVDLYNHAKIAAPEAKTGKISVQNNRGRRPICLLSVHSAGSCGEKQDCRRSYRILKGSNAIYCRI